jgi:general secretion pathway protein E
LPAAIQKPDLNGLKLYEPGKSEENPYGFQGQLAIREQFRMSEPIREVLENPKIVATTQNLEAAASQSGMRTMQQDGMLKVVAGETTLEELSRVVG